MNWIDLAIIIVVVFAAWAGYRQGFILAFSKLVSYFLGFIGAMLFYRSLAGYLETKLGLGSIMTELAKVVVRLPENVRNVPVGTLSLSNGQALIKTLGLPNSYQRQLTELISRIQTITKETDVTTVGDALHHLIGSVMLEVLAFLLIIVVVELVITLGAKGFVSMVHHTPAGFLDKGLGLAFGALKGVLVVLIVLSLINPLLSMQTLDKNSSLGILARGYQHSRLSAYLIAFMP